jgi:hypothetical protein
MTCRFAVATFIAGLGVGLGRVFGAAGRGQSIVICLARRSLFHLIAPYFHDQFVPAGDMVEVLPFQTPSKCKSAAVSKSVEGLPRYLRCDLRKITSRY